MWYDVDPGNTYKQVANVIVSNPNLEYINISNNGYSSTKTSELLTRMISNLQHQP